MKQALEYDAGGPWQQSAERIDGVGVALLVRVGKGVLWIVALFYTYGTLVHIISILSLSSTLITYLLQKNSRP